MYRQLRGSILSGLKTGTCQRLSAPAKVDTSCLTDRPSPFGNGTFVTTGKVNFKRLIRFYSKVERIASVLRRIVSKDLKLYQFDFNAVIDFRGHFCVEGALMLEIGLSSC